MSGNYQHYVWGGAGVVPITGTGVVTGPFKAIVAGADGAEITALGYPRTFAGFILAPGSFLPAGGSQQFTTVQLAAGSAYGVLV